MLHAAFKGSGCAAWLLLCLQAMRKYGPQLAGSCDLLVGPQLDSYFACALLNAVFQPEDLHCIAVSQPDPALLISRMWCAGV